MEKVKKSALRSEFIGYVLTTFLIVAVLCISVILGCTAIRERLVPNSNKMRLNWADEGAALSDNVPNMGYVTLDPAEPNEINPFQAENADETRVFTLGAERYAKNGVDFCVTRVYNSPKSLTPTNKFVYYGSGILMIALPILLSLSGILLCGFMFYDDKLKKPISLLNNATERISEQDLDFEISYDENNELGKLCGSFEKMRKALAENNEQMWQMLEERRQLQASVAHDLRNPIAIIKGHAEYLRMNYARLSEEKAMSLTDNIGDAAERLSHYTESIREINRLEDLKIRRESVDFAELFEEIYEDFRTVSDKITLKNNIGEHLINLDKQALYRIIENLVGNALRFAKSKINVDFSFNEKRLTVLVSDDGEGFSEKILRAKNKTFLTDKSDSTHSGLGLTICRILAQKHGGELSYENKNGAVVKIILLC